MNNKYPTISIITVTYNPDLKIFERSLKSIQQQNYQQKSIEHIILDGGSTNGTVKLAKKYKCKIIIKKNLRERSEARMYYGIKKTKNDIIFVLQSDNILPSKNSLVELVSPFLSDKKIFSVFSFHYAYNKNTSLVNRYFSLFGVSDPVVFYLNKADRESWLNDSYSKGKVIRKQNNYEVVEFNEKNLPTVGDNGFLIRKSVLAKAQIRPDTYFHTDILMDLLKLGYSRFGIVKSTSIEHVVGDNLFQILKRRVAYSRRDLTWKKNKLRRYHIFDLESISDLYKIFCFIINSLFLIQPIFLSIIGFIKIPDVAWFIHPYVCLLYLIVYLRMFIVLSVEKIFYKNDKK